MRDRDEGLVRVLDEGRCALDIADPVDQPVAIDLQDARDLRQLVDAGAGRASTKDVVDEGPVDAGHLGDVGGTDAELVRPGPQAVGKRVVLGHVIPTQLWMK